jgi:uncharacterized protein YcfL
MKTPLLSLAALLALGACSGPETYEAATIRFEGEDFDSDDPVVADVKVEVKSWLEDEVSVEEMVGRVLDGRLAAQFVLVNEDDEPVRVLLTWEWRDSDGVALREAASEKKTKYLVLRANESQRQTFTAPSDLAFQFFAAIEPTHKED